MSPCTTCSGTSTTQPRGQIDVPCKCGVDVGVPVSSIDAQRGVMVIHDILDPDQGKVDTLDDIKWVRCAYTTYVPPAVWCPSCQSSLVPHWKDLCVSGTSSEVEAAQQNYNPTVVHYQKMARDLISQHGPLKRVEYLSHFPKFEINFVFERQKVYSGERRGRHDIHFLSLGYVGEGPRYARFFLAEAGFPMSSEEIAAINPGARIEVHGGKVVVSYPDRDSNVDTAGSPAPTLPDDITLHKAIIQEDPAKVRALVDRGDDLHATDNDGATPLHYAAYVAHAEIAKILLGAGARVDATDGKGRTPLHEVAGHLHREGDEATIRALLDAGASLDARDKDGATPLHSAAMAGHHEAAALLLDRGANIEARAQQLTPLLFSAYAGKPEVTKLLIERGADVFAEKDGMDPLYMAKQPSHSTESGKRAVIQILEEAKARGRPADRTRSSTGPTTSRSVATASPPRANGHQDKKRWWQFWR